MVIIFRVFLGRPEDDLPRRSNAGAVEAPHITLQGGYYYLWVSFDRCCQGYAECSATAGFMDLVTMLSSPTATAMITVSLSWALIAFATPLQSSWRMVYTFFRPTSSQVLGSPKLFV
ncbi:hypothetical protein LZ554_006323 [Drepanopeziza brunnea f. sp. 'monogermtubi']|nr:hypothetical protein LZ554_006323 [Drepanopeziza brunnea f. sp. 'monogermtubi']